MFGPSKSSSFSSGSAPTIKVRCSTTQPFSRQHNPLSYTSRVNSIYHILASPPPLIKKKKDTAKHHCTLFAFCVSLEMVNSLHLQPAAKTFGKSPVDRHLSLQERKEALYNFAKRWEMFLLLTVSPWFSKIIKKKVTPQWFEIFQLEGHSNMVGLNVSISVSATVSIT